MRLVLFKAKEKGLEFKHFLRKSCPEIIHTDPLRLSQALNNLLSNAVKFTDSGFVRLYVRSISTSPGTCTILFSVKDSGVGIRKQDMETVFDKFTQTDDSARRRYGGVGLGLSIAKEIVELMGGRIGVKSHYGKGSDFHFSIPFKTR